LAAFSHRLAGGRNTLTYHKKEMSILEKIKNEPGIDKAEKSDNYQLYRSSILKI